jgi:hypothetical protein
VSVTVTPLEFKFVAYDATVIERVTQGLADSLGLGDRTISVDIDETTPLSRLRVDIGDTIGIRAESGALEDTKRPRQQSETATAIAVGRMLLRVVDRESGGFDEAPPDDELSLAQMAAWDTYSVGRLSRLGIEVNQQRWRYNFRNRHGFSDATDGAFDELWAASGLTWSELSAFCPQ